jgi:hypothetical protein
MITHTSSYRIETLNDRREWIPCEGRYRVAGLIEAQMIALAQPRPVQIVAEPSGKVVVSL